MYIRTVSINDGKHPFFLCVPLSLVPFFHLRQDSHLANEPVLVHWSALFPIRQSRRLRPHLLDVLEHHVAVPVEGLDAREELAIVADGDEDLGVRSDGRLEDREGARRELVLFELGDFVLAARMGCWD